MSSFRKDVQPLHRRAKINGATPSEFIGRRGCSYRSQRDTGFYIGGIQGAQEAQSGIMRRSRLCCAILSICDRCCSH
jgi:hypothetical protein